MTPLQTYAVMVLCARDVDVIWHKLPDQSANPVLPKAGDPDIGYVTDEYFSALAQLRCDDLFVARGVNTYYGLVLRCIKAVGPFERGDYLVAVRGTMDDLEWVNDALAAIPTPVPSAHGVGQVGHGFWQVYASMTTSALAGGPHAHNPAATIAGMVAAAPGRLFVTGHSLGAALATYLAADLELAVAKSTIQLLPYFFASPRVGSSDYVANYRTSVTTYSLVNYAADLVPMVPPDWFFATLSAGGPTHDVHVIPRGAPGCLPSSIPNNHSPVGYARMLDPANAVAAALAP